MLRTLIRRLLYLFAAIVVVAGTLYAFGLRPVLDGGSGLQFAFVQSSEDRAAEIEQHRAAQRAQAPPPAVPETPASTPAATAPATEAVTTAATASAEWPVFRGPDHNGHYARQPVRTDWGISLTPLWKQPVGSGHASFVTAGGRAFTIEQRGAREMAAAYDLATGREIWTSAWDARFDSSMGGDGPRATPAWHEGRLYALGGTGELRALDAATGRTLWRTNILADAGATNMEHGTAASPLIVDNVVVVMPGGRNGQSVVAYDRVFGTRAWSVLDDRPSYASPILVTLAGVRQIVAFTESRLVGLSPEGGTLLWAQPLETFNQASQPLAAGPDRLFFSTPTEAVMIQLVPGSAEQLSVRELWRTNRLNNHFSSSVIHEGHIYGLDETILTCLDASTGALKWKGGRYGYGQIMLVTGQIIVLTEQGELALVRAVPSSHQELTRFAAIDGKTWNHPAMSNGILLVRNTSEMAAFDLSRQR